MLDLVNSIDEVFIQFATQAEVHGATPADLELAMMSLWKIIGYNLFDLFSSFQDKRKFYGAAGNTRLLLECVTDAQYLSAHPDQAQRYWKNQEKIKADLITNVGNEWKLLVDGTLNKYGELDDKTKVRIKTTLGDDAMGAYNFLCFFTHPNVATIFWLDNDVKGTHALYILDIAIKLLATFIDLLAKYTSIGIDRENYLQRLQRIHKDFISK